MRWGRSFGAIPRELRRRFWAAMAEFYGSGFHRAGWRHGLRLTRHERFARLAAQSAQALEVQGFHTSVVYEPPTGTTKGVTITHAKGEAAAARTVAAAFAGAKLKVDETLPIGTVEVSLGSGAPAVQEVPNREGDQPLPESSIAAPPAPTAVKTRAASEDICG